MTAGLPYDNLCLRIRDANLFWGVGRVCVLFLSGLLPSCIAMTLISLMACRPLKMAIFRDGLRDMTMSLCDLENAENEYVSNALKML